jgi:hypothetical protein
LGLEQQSLVGTGLQQGRASLGRGQFLPQGLGQLAFFEHLGLTPLVGRAEGRPEGRVQLRLQLQAARHLSLEFLLLRGEFSLQPGHQGGAALQLAGAPVRAPLQVTLVGEHGLELRASIPKGPEFRLRRESGRAQRLELLPLGLQLRLDAFEFAAQFVGLLGVGLELVLLQGAFALALAPLEPDRRHESAAHGLENTSEDELGDHGGAKMAAVAG